MTSEREEEEAADNVNMECVEQEAKGREDTLSTKGANNSPNMALRRKRASIRGKRMGQSTEDLLLKRKNTTSLGNLDIDFSTGFGATEPNKSSSTLTVTSAPGSHSTLFGLTPNEHKETKVDYTSSQAKAAHSIQNSPNLNDTIPASVMGCQF